MLMRTNPLQGPEYFSCPQSKSLSPLVQAPHKKTGGNFVYMSCHFRAQKSLDFQGTPLPMDLLMDLPSSSGEDSGTKCIYQPGPPQLHVEVCITRGTVSFSCPSTSGAS